MLIDKIEFESKYYTETSHGITGEYESCPHTMELYVEGDDGAYILWCIDEENGDLDEICIGLEIEGKDVIGYDGVFELPIQAQELLKNNGYNLEEL